MYNGKTVSLKNVLWKVFNNPLAQNLSYELAAEFAVEAIRLIGAPLAYVDKVTDPPLKVIDYKTVIPNNIVLVRGARAFATREDTATPSMAVPMTRATNIFHKKSECETCDGFDDGKEITYVIQANILTASFKEGFIELAYQALATDEDGFPLIPDNQKYLLAVEYYILYRFLQPLNIIGKIPDSAFGKIEQLRFWYVPSAQAEMQISDLDHAEAIFSSINRLIVNSSAQRNFFAFMGKYERLKKFN